VPVVTKELTPAIAARVEAVNDELAGRGRVLVRGSGTEPVVRVLAEAENEEEAEELCGTIAALVSTELG
jgi:phosphoglucosamine mutase